MTNNSIFTRVLALMICLVMLVGTLTACFQETDHNHNVGTTTNGEVTTKPTTTTTTTTTGDVVEDEPTEDPVDPNVIFSASTDILSDGLIYGTLASDVVIGGAEMGALVPADVKVEAGASNLALSVKKVDEVLLSDALSTLDVHINGVALDNTVPMIVKLGAILEAGLGTTELKLYHTENGVDNLMTRVNRPSDFAIHNQYYYNAETGEVTIYVASFSVFSAVKTSASKWEDTTEADTSWYNDEDIEFTLNDVADFLGFRNLVDGGNTFEGKTVILATDIDLSDKPFDPIGFGYWYEKNVVEGKDQNTVFMGTFDGGNHTIYNLYENCWELDPDKTNYGTYTYSTAGAGLFASIKNATVKNLAISGAEIVFECVDMGIVVGYAQGVCHFENIVVTDSKIANYNRYTGGVVGEVSYGPYGIDTSLGYSHTFKNITVDSSVTVSGLWGSFGCGMGGVIGGKWGDATVKMENVVSAPVMDVYNDVVSAYQWYAFRGCGMLIGHTEEPYSNGRTSGNATAKFLTCVNVNVYYGDWTKYNYYEFKDQDSDTGKRYPWVRAEEGKYCEAFSNIRYGVPTHNGVKVSDLTEEELKAIATNYTTIVFNQLYGADRGMYGKDKHDGVTTHNSLTKTIYVQNNLGWENLKLYYWYLNGDERWTTVPEGITLTEENGVYKVDLPAYAHGYQIIADGENATREFYLSEVEENGTYTLDFEHVHNFNPTACDCGAVKQVLEHQFTLGENGEAKHSDGGNMPESYAENGYTLTLEGLSNVYGNARDAMGNSCIKLGTSSAVGKFSFTVPEEINEVIIYVSGREAKDAKVSVNGVEYEITTHSDDGKYTAITVDTSENKTVEFTTVSLNGEERCMINTISYVTTRVVEIHECDENEEIPAVDPTCTNTGLTSGKACSVCGKVMVEQNEVAAIGHTEETLAAVEVTCTKNGLTEGKKCSVCKEILVAQETIPSTGHNYVGGTCENCGAAFPTTAGTYTYVFANYTEGVQYAKGEEHKLDENVTITTYDCHFTDELRIYSSSTNNGYAIIYSVNPISKIGVNAGNKEDTINIYGSDDGVNWTEEPIATISVTSTSYKDYTVELQGEYKYIKLDVAGGNQVRIKSMTLTTVPDCAHASTTTETVAPTCTEAGYTVTMCASCGKEIGDRVPGEAATGHDYNGVQTTAPTCLTVGEMTYTCSKCTDSYTEEIATLSHTTDNGICENCGEQIGETVEPEPKEKTYSYTFTSKQYSANGKKELGDINWTLAGDGGYWGYDGTKGQQFGSGNSPYKELTLTSDLFENVSEIVINTSGASSTNAKLNVYVGNTLIKTITLTSSATEYTIDVSNLSGEVKFEFTQTSSKAIYVKSVKVTYAESSGSGSEGGETEHTHSYNEDVTAPTCTEGGYTTYTCSCGDEYTDNVVVATGHNYVDGACTVCGEEDPDYNEGGTTEPEEVEATLSFADKAQRTSFSTSKQVWEQNGITFTNDKSSSTNNVADYSNPVRLYAGSKVTIEAQEITKIVFDCNNTSYATAIKNSIGTVSGATVTVSSDKVTVEFTTPVGSFTIAKLTAQVRMDSITVTYTK